MSDRTYFQLVIHSATPDELTALRAALDGDEEPPDLADLRGADEEPEDGDDFPLLWGWEECRLAAATEYGPLIAAIMPGATFAAWTDPNYEYAGDLYQHAPDLGEHVSPCDANGHATIRDVDLAEIMGRPGIDDTAALVAVGRLLGLAWYRRMFGA